MNDYPTLDEWVHDAGRMVVIGDAAHPLPVSYMDIFPLSFVDHISQPGATQSLAMGVEDGAVLAKLFSHLRTEDQIGSFLWAFQDIRQPRCDSISVQEQGILFFMTLSPGEHQEQRDNSMRAKRDAGIGVLQASSELEESPEWAEIKEIFGYDAEDEADNWWVAWGLLRERAKGMAVSYPMPVTIEQKVVST